MAKTQYYTACSLDGFIADADHSLQWLMELGEMENGTFGSFIENVGAVVMGSHTYEWILQNHTFADPENPKPWDYAQPTWVFSNRTLKAVPDADIRFVAGDVQPIFEQIRLVCGEKNVWLAGGGDLVGQFYDRGLLDEIIVQFAPVTLGSGKPFLPRRITHPALVLTSAKKHGLYVELRYDVHAV